MIIDFRLRPPYKSFCSIVARNYDSTVELTGRFNMKPDPSVKAKSMELLLQEKDEAGIDMGVAPCRIGHFNGIMYKKLRLLEVDAAILKAVQEKYGLQPGVIPGSYYEGQMSKGDIPVATATTELIIGKDVPDDIAYKITKSICEHRDDIVLALPSWASFQPETAWEGLAAPLHPGAARYYKEKGWME